METFINHALGICGEHSHPNLFTLAAVVAVMYFIYKFNPIKSNGKAKTN